MRLSVLISTHECWRFFSPQTSVGFSWRVFLLCCAHYLLFTAGDGCGVALCDVPGCGGSLPGDGVAPLSVLALEFLSPLVFARCAVGVI